MGELRAVLVGGAAGSFVGPEALDLPLTVEDTRAKGLSLGSGAIVVFDEATDFVAVVSRLAEFFAHESCGQCVPCREGTRRQHEILARSTGRPVGGDEVTLLADLAAVMGDASICGLGQTAANAVQSALELGLVGGGR